LRCFPLSRLFQLYTRGSQSTCFKIKIKQSDLRRLDAKLEQKSVSIKMGGEQAGLIVSFHYLACNIHISSRQVIPRCQTVLHFEPESHSLRFQFQDSEYCSYRPSPILPEGTGHWQSNSRRCPDPVMLQLRWARLVNQPPLDEPIAAG
jgi:hypothetical protein